MTNDANLIFNRSDALGVKNAISGTGSVTQAGNGTTTLTGVNTYAGATTVDAGTLDVTGSIGSTVISVNGTGQLIADGASLADDAALTLRDSANLTITGNEVIGNVAGDTGATIDLGNQTLTFGSGVLKSDFAGVVSGVGGNLVIDGAFVSLSGANTFTGTTTIKSAGLILESGQAIADTGAVIVDGGYLGLAADETIGSLAGLGGSVELGTFALTTGAEVDTTYAGAITGAGALVKQGSGTMTLTGDSSFSGTTTLNEGGLVVNGTLASDLTLNAGTLGGTGTVGSFIANAGSGVAPGNSIGTLTVAGEARFEPGATLQVEVAANGNADRIVADTAVINGGTVRVVALDPETSYVDGTQSTIIETANGRIGEFDAVQDDLGSVFISFSLDYTPNDVILSADLAATPVVPPVGPTDPETPTVDPVAPPPTTPVILSAAALTGNQFAIARALDALSQQPGSDALAVFNQVLASQSHAEARVAFDQASGEIHAAGQVSLAQGAGDFLRVMQDRDQAGAAPAVAPQALSFASQPQGRAAGDAVSSWGAVFGSQIDLDADGRAAGSVGAAAIDGRTSGLALGIEATSRGVFDNLLGDASTAAGGDFTVGLSLGYSSSATDLAMSTADSDTAHLGTYVKAQFGQFHLSTAASASFSGVETARDIRFGTLDRTARASYDARTYAAAAELQYRAELGGFQMSPFAGVSVATVRSDGFTETGAGALNLTAGSDSYRAGQTTLGVEVARDAVIGSIPVSLDSRLGYAWGFGDDRADRQLTLTGAPGSAFAISSADAGRDSVTLGLGATATLRDDLTLSVRYDGAFADGSNLSSGQAMISYRF